jgi:hypothetical protein
MLLRVSVDNSIFFDLFNIMLGLLLSSLHFSHDGLALDVIETEIMLLILKMLLGLGSNRLKQIQAL